MELREADAPPNADDTSKTSRSKRYILVLPVIFVEFTSIPRVTNPIPVVVDDTPVLEKQPEHVNLRLVSHLPRSVEHAL